MCHSLDFFAIRWLSFPLALCLMRVERQKRSKNGTKSVQKQFNLKPQIEPQQSGAAIDPDLFSALGVLWRGKIWIVLAALAGIALAYAYVQRFTVPFYPAVAEVALESGDSGFLDPEGLFLGGGAGLKDINTEIRVIRSRKLVGRVVDALGLVNDPEFGGVTGDANDAIRDRVIESVRNSVSVQNFEFSFVFNVRVTTQDPQKSVLIANTLAETYIQSQLEEKFEEAERASTWLSDRAADLKITLENSEAAIKEFNDNTDLVNPETLQAQLRQLKELRSRLDDLETRKAETRQTLDATIAATESGDISALAGQVKDQRIGRLLSQLQNGTLERAVFDLRLATLVQQLEQDAQRATEQFQTLEASENSFSQEVNAQSDDLVQLQQLQREAEANRLLYESFLQRLKETAVQKGLQTSDSRLLSKAVPLGASSPRTERILAMGGLLGALLGMGLVFLGDMRQSSFLSAEELEQVTGHAVLGSIPQLNVKGRKEVLNYARQNPSSHFAEAVRNLRTSVLLSDIDNPPQVIMTTSSVPGEGKTTQALTLAQNMAGLNKRVLVIEGDIRRRMFSEVFNIRDHPSFIDVLSGKTDLKQALYRPANLDFDILVGAKSSVNAADIFSSDTFAQFIKHIRQYYDFVIIDTPPVLVVPDARVIGQHVDAIIYNVLFDGPSRTMVRKGISLIESVGLQIAGLSLTQVNSKKMNRKGYEDTYGYGKYSSYFEN